MNCWKLGYRDRLITPDIPSAKLTGPAVYNQVCPEMYQCAAQALDGTVDWNWREIHLPA